jgi:hypothetical protein
MIVRLFEGNRTVIIEVKYSLYLYFLGLSLRKHLMQWSLLRINKEVMFLFGSENRDSVLLKYI